MTNSIGRAGAVQKEQGPRRILVRVIVISVGLSLVGLSLFAYRSARPVQAAGKRFHDQLDGEKFEEIVREANPISASVGNDADLIRLLRDVHETLGRTTFEHPTAIDFSSKTAGKFITLEDSTRFRNGVAVETIAWKRSGHSLQLCHYEITSKLMSGEWHSPIWPSGIN